MQRRLGIIGGGNMGAAIVRGVIERGVLAGSDLIVAEIDAVKRDALRGLGCEVTEDATEVPARRCDEMLLAVKPQGFANIAAAMRPTITRPMIVISIMAGLHSSRIRAALGDWVRVVRAMPNLPCQIGKGATAIAPGAGAKPGDEALAVRVFNALGITVEVNESLMHAVTAVSGSGPAYVFLLAEAMQQAAKQMGIPHAAARRLVTQTMAGAGVLLDAQTERTATQHRQAVTSPGGTTAAALEVMFEKELPEIVVEALLAARDRGVELDAPGE